MRTKLTLNLEDLSVDSFETTVVQQEKGTVFGEQEPCTCQTQCTCPGCPSCYESCDGSCDATCGVADTCYVSCRPSKCETCYITCTEPNTLDYC
jgi:hypothetical protein